MTTYLVTTHELEFACPYCGTPVYVGDTAIDDIDNTGECFCSKVCARRYWYDMHDEPTPDDIADGQAVLCTAYDQHLRAEISLARQSKA